MQGKHFQEFWFFITLFLRLIGIRLLRLVAQTPFEMLHRCGGLGDAFAEHGVQWVSDFSLEAVKYPLDYVLSSLMLASLEICFCLGRFCKRHDSIANIVLDVVPKLCSSVRQRCIFLLFSCVNLRLELGLCILHFVELR